jgi:hypothetical protein
MGEARARRIPHRTHHCGTGRTRLASLITTHHAQTR